MNFIKNTTVLLFTISIFISNISYASKHRFCANSFLAKRTSKESCYVYFLDEMRRQICIPRNIWKLYLQAKPINFCGELTGKWMSFNINEKKIIRRFKVDNINFKNNQDNPTFLIKASWHIERMRDNISSIIEPYDEFGIVRHLIISETSPRGVSDLFRKLGFVLNFWESNSL